MMMSMEIEITPAMIEAGASVLRSLGLGVPDGGFDIAEDVLFAALEAGRIKVVNAAPLQK